MIEADFGFIAELKACSTSAVQYKILWLNQS